VSRRVQLQITACFCGNEIHGSSSALSPHCTFTLACSFIPKRRERQLPWVRPWCQSPGELPKAPGCDGGGREVAGEGPADSARPSQAGGIGGTGPATGGGIR